MMFDRYPDGVLRATMRITHRVDLSAVAEAMALWAYEADAGADPFDQQLRTMSRAQAETLLRERLNNQGPPDRWDDAPNDDYYTDLRELADTRAAELFGNTPTN